MMHLPNTVFPALMCIWSPTRGTGPQHRGLVPNMVFVFISTFSHFSVPRSGELFPVNVNLAPNYTFEGEDPWVYQEDHDCRVDTLVERPRMFPQVQLPQIAGAPVLDFSQVDLGLVAQLHDVTGRVLAQVRGQPHGPSPVPAPTRPQPLDDSSVFSPWFEGCPICKKSFREFNKLKVHFSTKHKRDSEHMCPKCGKALGTAANLSSHLENFHKYKTMCILLVNMPHSTRRIC